MKYRQGTVRFERDSSAPADGSYQFGNLLWTKRQIPLFLYREVQRQPGVNRPYYSHTLPGTSFLENRWREPVPWETEAENSLALVHAGGYAWLECPSGIWRASLSEEALDLSEDILGIKQSLDQDRGELMVVLKKKKGQYSFQVHGAQGCCRPAAG
jgi:hypothetical protein